MSRPFGVPHTSIPSRPTMTNLVTAPEGRSFCLTFLPDQVLPDHRNRQRVRLESRRGAGTLTVAGAEPVRLAEGAAVQLEANALHALAATEGPWEVAVTVLADCCPGCA